MNVTKAANGVVDITMSKDERYLIKECLNECCYGIRIPDFTGTIGADKALVSRLLDQLDSGADQSQPGPDNLQIARVAADQWRVRLSREQAHIFINCMDEIEKRLGPSAFPAHFGAKIDEVKALFSAIKAQLN